MLNSPQPIPFARELANNPAQQAASAYVNRLRTPGRGTAIGGERLQPPAELLPGHAAAGRAVADARKTRALQGSLGARTHRRFELLPRLAAVSADRRRSRRTCIAARSCELRRARAHPRAMGYARHRTAAGAARRARRTRARIDDRTPRTRHALARSRGAPLRRRPRARLHRGESKSAWQNRRPASRSARLVRRPN